MENIRHLIITRFFYDDIELFRKRLKLMNETLVKSLKKQTNKAFQLVVMADKFKVELIKELKYPFITFSCYEDLQAYIKNTGIHIQTRMDSDDMFAPDFVEFVHNLKTEGKTLLSLNYKEYDYPAMKENGRISNYNNQRTSMFLTLYDKIGETSVYGGEHTTMWQSVDYVITPDRIDLVKYIVHNDQLTKTPVKERASKFRFFNYWENRYRQGGNSGAGSYGRLAIFKANVINDVINKHEVNSLIEFGCGDGEQLKLYEVKEYTGIDISETALRMCRKKHPDKTFAKHATGKYDMAMSIDVIFHLVDDEMYNDYMRKLKKASDLVLIYSSAHDNNENSAPHVKHRDFRNEMKGFECIDIIANQYPFDGTDERNTSFCDFYLYKKAEAMTFKDTIKMTQTIPAHMQKCK